MYKINRNLSTTQKDNHLQNFHFWYIIIHVTLDLSWNRFRWTRDPKNPEKDQRLHPHSHQVTDVSYRTWLQPLEIAGVDDEKNEITISVDETKVGVSGIQHIENRSYRAMECIKWVFPSPDPP